MHRLTLRGLACLFLCIALPLAAMTSGCAEASSPTESGIAWLMELYGYKPPEEAIHAMRESFQPQAFDCGLAQVTLQEVLYDGVWLYTSATVTPTDPETTLILPDGAGIDDLVAGGYGENLRSDPRSYRAAALEDGKELLLVRVYPLEFNQAGYYYTDLRQDAGDQSTLLGAAPLGGLEEALTLHLSIQLESIDPSTGKVLSTSNLEFPIDIRRIGAINRREYQTDREDVPFRSLHLIQTPLTVYALPEGDLRNDKAFSLLDMDFTPVQRDMLDGGYTYVLADLPEKLHVQLGLPDEGTGGSIVLFESTPL